MRVDWRCLPGVRRRRIALHSTSLGNSPRLQSGTTLALRHARFFLNKLIWVVAIFRHVARRI